MKLFIYSIISLVFLFFGLQTLSTEPAPYSCPSCDLAKKDFSGQDLTNANFLDANLEGANFKNATLDGAVFSNAILAGADFTGASCNASEKGPTLFLGANLNDAKFNKTKLYGTRFEYARINSISFTEVDLRHTVFGPKLYFDRANKNEQPRFDRVQLSCEFPVYWKYFNLRDTDLPTCANYKESVQDKRRDLAGGRFEIYHSATNSYRVEDRFLRNLSVPETVSDTIYVATTGSDSTGIGTLNNPYQTISKGIEACGEDTCAVFVEYGEYYVDGTIQLKPTVSLYGGMVNGDPTTYQSSISDTLVFSSILSASFAGASPDFTDTTYLSGFILNGTTPPITYSAEGTTTLQCIHCDGLKLEYLQINAGKGQSLKATGQNNRGQDGADGQNATATASGAGGSGGGGAGGRGAGLMSVNQVCQCTLPLCLDCDFTVTFSGGPGVAGQPGDTNSSAAGGAAGTPAQSKASHSATPTVGQNGVDGADCTVCGEGGTPSDSLKGVYIFQEENHVVQQNYWMPNGFGGAGTNGCSGGGGGGGGSGGACAHCNLACKGMGYEGTAAGGGGSGGAGAYGGLGGNGGGASFGLVVINANLHIGTSVYITANSGGIGQDGANGGAGGKGGAGGAPYPSDKICSNTGAAGGYGGAGGDGSAGGGGAGGNGGPSIALAMVDTAAINGIPIYYIGKGGAPGAGGKGGAPRSTGMCTGEAGQAGISGLVDSTFHFTSQSQANQF